MPSSLHRSCSGHGPQYLAIRYLVLFAMVAPAALCAQSGTSTWTARCPAPLEQHLKMLHVAVVELDQKATVSVSGPDLKLRAGEVAWNDQMLHAVFARAGLVGCQRSGTHRSPNLGTDHARATTDGEAEVERTSIDAGNGSREVVIIQR